MFYLILTNAMVAKQSWFLLQKQYGHSKYRIRALYENSRLFHYLKYGYDRVTDCCTHIRRGRMTREEAIKINQAKSGKFPEEYLGYKLSEVLNEINCSREEFIKICDKFTNKAYLYVTTIMK